MYVKVTTQDGNPVSSTNGFPVQLTGSSLQDDQALPVKQTGSIVTDKVAFKNLTVGAGATVQGVSALSLDDRTEAIAVFIKETSNIDHSYEVLYRFNIPSAGSAFSYNAKSLGTFTTRSDTSNFVDRRGSTLQLLVKNNDTVSHTYNAYVIERIR